MHQLIGEPEHRLDPPPEDLWFLEEEGRKRKVGKIIPFAHYALSPSTSEVLLFGAFDAPNSLAEIRAYGPRDKMVWYEVPEWDPFIYSLVGGLLRELRKLNRVGMG